MKEITYQQRCPHCHYLEMWDNEKWITVITHKHYVWHREEMLMSGLAICPICNADLYTQLARETKELYDRTANR